MYTLNFGKGTKSAFKRGRFSFEHSRESLIQDLPARFPEQITLSTEMEEGDKYSIAFDRAISARFQFAFSKIANQLLSRKTLLEGFHAAMEEIFGKKDETPSKAFSGKFPQLLPVMVSALDYRSDKLLLPGKSLFLAIFHRVTGTDKDIERDAVCYELLDVLSIEAKSGVDCMVVVKSATEFLIVQKHENNSRFVGELYSFTIAQAAAMTDPVINLSRKRTMDQQVFQQWENAVCPYAISFVGGFKRDESVELITDIEGTAAIEKALTHNLNAIADTQLRLAELMQEQVRLTKSLHDWAGFTDLPWHVNTLRKYKLTPEELAIVEKAEKVISRKHVRRDLLSAFLEEEFLPIVDKYSPKHQ